MENDETIKLEDIMKIRKMFTPLNEEVAHKLRELALDLKELAVDVKILRPESIYFDAMAGVSNSLFELAHDIEEGGAIAPCNICGDCHDVDSIPLSCQTGDGE